MPPQLEVTVCDLKILPESPSFKVTFCDLKSVPALEVTNCDLKFVTSSLVNWNMNRSGKRSMLRLTAWLSAFVGTPYSSARSRSSMTCTPRIVSIRERMASATVGSGEHSTTSLDADVGTTMFFLAISFLFCLVAIRAPVPPRTPLHAHHARRLPHSKANPQENQCKIFVKACKKILRRFYTVFTRGVSPCQHGECGGLSPFVNPTVNACHGIRACEPS